MKKVEIPILVDCNSVKWNNNGDISYSTLQGKEKHDKVGNYLSPTDHKRKDEIIEFLNFEEYLIEFSITNSCLNYWQRIFVIVHYPTGGCVEHYCLVNFQVNILIYRLFNIWPKGDACQKKIQEVISVITERCHTIYDAASNMRIIPRIPYKIPDHIKPPQEYVQEVFRLNQLKVNRH